jgi:dTDP-4-dehydrorhamnose 3,5-epimerase-like enzyme
MDPIEIIAGEIFSDHRGEISFINDFEMGSIKRFYTIQHPGTTIVRAWQGHKNESKWFFVSAGVFQVKLVKIDNWECPSNELRVHEFVLSADKCQVLKIPGGYANGFRALHDKSKMVIFSNFTKEESVSDFYRFDENKWGVWTS